MPAKRGKVKYLALTAISDIRLFRSPYFTFCILETLPRLFETKKKPAFLSSSLVKNGKRCFPSFCFLCALIFCSVFSSQRSFLSPRLVMVCRQRGSFLPPLSSLPRHKGKETISSTLVQLELLEPHPSYEKVEDTNFHYSPKVVLKVGGWLTCVAPETRLILNYYILATRFYAAA